MNLAAILVVLVAIAILFEVARRIGVPYPTLFILGGLARLGVGILVAGRAGAPGPPVALAARAHAFLNGRGYVTPQDVKSVGADVLRHRIIVSYEAEAEGVTSETIIERIFAGLPVP